MEPLDDSFGDLGCPTELECLRHQSDMLCEEVADLNRKLRRSQQNISKLVEINAEAAVAYRLLKGQLNEANERISQCLLKSGQDWAEMDTLRRVAYQVDELQRERQELFKKLRAMERP